MDGLNSTAKRWAIERLPFPGPRFGGAMRLIAGLGINAIGAGVLLADSLRFLGLPL